MKQMTDAVVVNIKKHMFRKGQVLRKANYTSFAGMPYVTVDEVQTWSEGFYRINGRFIIHPDNIVLLDQDAVMFLEEVWKDSGILSNQVDVEGRVPCSRGDGVSKQPVSERDMQAKLFEIRMKRGDMSFQAYRCPDCGLIHIGRNPYASRDFVGRAFDGS